MKPKTIKRIGFFASIISTASFAPQAYGVWSKMPDPARAVSLPMYLILISGCSLWFIYGISIRSRPIWLTNIFIMVLALSIVAYKLIYG